VMFLSDNGGCSENGALGFDRGKPGAPCGSAESFMSYGLAWANASNTPFRRFKRWSHEGGIATPLIVRWPNVIKQGGQITGEVGHVIDLMATCTDVAGATYPSTFKDQAITPLEGKSLAPIFRTGTRPGHDALYWEHEGTRAIRQGPWKLVAVNRQDWELYNLEADRTEMHNLVEQHPEKAGELKGLYEAWCKKCGVVTPDDLRERLNTIIKLLR